jgi:MFS family permease
MESKKMHYAWWILVSGGVIAFGVLGVIYQCLGIFFTPVCEELGIPRGSFSFHVSLIWIVMIFALPIAGRQMSKKNAKQYLFFSVAILCGTFAAMSRFTNVYHWYAGGVLMGLSSSVCLYLPVPMLINNWFKKKVGMAMGIALAMSGVGGAIFNPLGAWIIKNYGWRNGDLALGLSAAVITLPVILFVVRFKPSEMGLKRYGEEESMAPSQDGAFVSTELTGLTTGEAFGKVAFYSTVLFSALLTMCVSVSSFFPSYVASIGLDPVTGGLMLSVVAIGAILGKISLGNMNDKLGVGKTITIASALGAAGLAAILTGGTTLPLLYGGSFLFGFSAFAMVTVQVPMVVRHFFGQKGYGSIYSFVQSGTTLCQAFVMTLYGVIYDRTQSHANSLAASIAFLVAAYLMYLITSSTGKNLFEKGKSA